MRLSSLAASCFSMPAIVSAAPATSNGAQGDIAGRDTSPNPLYKRQSAGTIYVGPAACFMAQHTCATFCFSTSIDLEFAVWRSSNAYRYEWRLRAFPVTSAPVSPGVLSIQRHRYRYYQLCVQPLL